MGLACYGIDRNAATLALGTGTLAAILTWRSLRSTPRETPISQKSPKWLTWLVAAIFAAFALRAFSEALFISNGRLYANDPYDPPMHVSYINYLASGVAFWPTDCIYSRESLHYPIGADLFTSLLVIEGAPIRCASSPWEYFPPQQ